MKSDKATKTVNVCGDSWPEELWAIRFVVDGVEGNIKDWKKVE